MKNDILNLLKKQDAFISGEKIASRFNMTRAGIWKYMNALKEDGYIIESVPKKGYKLMGLPDILNYEEIKEYLNTNFVGRNIEYYESLDSTNKTAKVIANKAKEGTVVVAEEQIKGKGRLGREWVSPVGKGIYMTIILKPHIEPIKVSRITLLGAAAVSKALENLGIKGLIKWPNDILINEKKISGILTEMSGELNRVEYVLMGIGINVNLDRQDIPENLKDKATSIKIEEDKVVDRKKLMAEILNELEKFYIDFKNNGNIEDVIKICRENSIIIGKEVNIIRQKEIRKGLVVDIDEDGQLIVEFDNGIEKIHSGEVSIRGLNAYV